MRNDPDVRKRSWAIPGAKEDWHAGTRVWWAEDAYIGGKGHDMNVEFGIIMPPGTPALVLGAVLDEPEVKSIDPPEAGMVPIHWNRTGKCWWEHAHDLATELHPEVRKEAEHLLAAARREAFKVVGAKSKRKPTLSVSVDEELRARVDEALRAVGSTYREHTLAFLHWFVRDTDELPARPDYPLPYFPYGE